VVGVLQMDMTNFRSPASETDIRVMTDNSNAALVQFLRDLFATYMAPAGFTLGNSACGYACSDHASWTESGFPSAMYDEGPFFPLLHTPNDRLENMGGDAQHATIIARLGLAFLGELGKNTATPRDRLMPPGGPAPPPGDGPRRRL
jgi:leucyl aminopeptidase